jgi:glycosyltransferase involved in cell wall biosynthesis
MISVIVPVYNEEKAIAASLDKLRKALDSFAPGSEMIVVDDGSTDNSLTMVRGLTIPAMSVIEHPENIGYGKSLLDGILSAKNECIAIIDADGSYPAEALKNLFSFYPRFDMIVGARQGFEYRKGFFKRPARLMFKSLAKYATGRNIPDVNSGLRIFKKSLVLENRKMLCTGFSFTTTITLLFMLNNHYVKYVPVEYHKREGKSKVNHFRDTLRAGQIIVQTIANFNAIKLFLLLANISACCGIIAETLNVLFLHSYFVTVFSACMLAAYIPIFALGLTTDAITKR